jgi:hypothetical protein
MEHSKVEYNPNTNSNQLYPAFLKVLFQIEKYNKREPTINFTRKITVMSHPKPKYKPAINN